MHWLTSELKHGNKLRILSNVAKDVAVQLYSVRSSDTIGLFDLRKGTQSDTRRACADNEGREGGG